MVRNFRGRLGAFGALAILVAVAVSAPAASSRPTGHAASTSELSFTISQPANSQVKLGFTSGITNIVEQATTGNSLKEVTAGSAGFIIFFGTPPPSESPTSTVIIDGQLSSGTPIKGVATLPAGATVSASVNSGPAQTINNGQFSITTPTTLGGVQGPTLKVTPGRVRAGRRVNVSGNVAGGCVRGHAVTLLSRAFTNTYTFASIPAIHATVGSQGGFSVKTTIPASRKPQAASRKPGKYTITGRCGGGNLGVVAHL
jgi:hypothetical protein